ncbi:MAG: ribbon-helix-helix protein, CopG family [Xanthomonadales bacterium]|nr:hypothetical protein [Xanthomonadales bacterium]MCC6594603.1 ribbon-helix-helix protein, CopG family [Xanthomonadales bacterium]MCE7932805.1 ribbon-helix-helix protein, CopG family [Xanthomonadales bacterium PRO6]
MRTTLTLDDDLAARLEELSQRRGVSFKQVVNDTIRKGLAPSGGRTLDLPSYSCGGPLPGIDLDKALQLDAKLENEYLRQKLLAGK